MQRGQDPGKTPARAADDVAARLARQRWGDEVRQALAEQGLSVHACARRAGISPGSLQAWLNQDVEPAPRSMERLARVLGRSHFRLVSLLGWLPEELGDVSTRFEATEKLRDALAEAERWVEAATEIVGLSGGGVLASELLQASEDWEITLRHSVRGRKHRARFVTAAGISPVGQPAAKGPPDRTEADRATIEALIHGAIDRTNARWSRPERAEMWGLKRSDLVLEAPVLLASKPRGVLPNRVVPSNIVVAGVPFTGAPEVAALIASALDWSYTDLRTATRLSFGISANPDDEVGAQSEVADRLLRDAKAGGKSSCWAWNAVGSMLETFSEVGRDRPLVVFLEAPPSLVEYAEKVRGYAGALKAQDLVRGTLARRAEDTSLTLQLPELPLPVQDELLHDVDVFFDAYVECAFEAVRWLADKHGGPPLDEAKGAIGEIWRAPGHTGG